MLAIADVRRTVSQQFRGIGWSVWKQFSILIISLILLFAVLGLIILAFVQGSWQSIMLAGLILPCAITVIWTHHDNYLIVEFLLGNRYRLMPTHTGTATVLGIHTTSSYRETHAVAKQAGAGWPYGGWYASGERFVTLELAHAGRRFRTCMHIDKIVYACLQAGQSIPITYQLARGPNGHKTPPLARIKIS